MSCDNIHIALIHCPNKKNVASYFNINRDKKTIVKYENVMINIFNLVSGAKPTAVEGCGLLRQLTAAAQGRIVIMAGAGVKSSNVAEIMQKTGVTECHASAKMRRYAQCNTVSFTTGKN